MAEATKLDVLVDGLTFPEGPRWHDGRFWFSDFYSHRVLAVDGAGKLETVVEVPRRLLRLDGGKLAEVADLSALATGPCNDMVVDGQGRAWVGNFGYDRHRGEAQRTTCIVRVDPDGRMTKAAEDLLFPNGTVITPDGRTLIVGETFAHRLTAFDIAADGTLSNRRIWAQIEGCYPDGICLDAERAIWVSDPFGHRLVRVFEGGRIAREIDLAPRGANACILRGADRRTLHVCTNSGSGPSMADKRDGRIETLRVDAPGAGWP